MDSLEEFLVERNISKKSIPYFAYKIFDNSSIELKSKKKFIRKILSKFINKEINDCKIVFADGIYLGIFDDSIDYSSYDKLFFYDVSTDSMNCFASFMTTPLETSNLSMHHYRPFYVKCSLYFECSNMKITESLCLVDTGCERSSLFPENIWDYENECFKETTDGLFYSYKNEIEELNQKILEVKEENVSGSFGGGKKFSVNFSKPIKIGIEGLEPVEINFLLVSKIKPKKDLVVMIGLDVLCQYDVNITKKNGEPVLTITEPNPTKKKSFFPFF